MVKINVFNKRRAVQKDLIAHAIELSANKSTLNAIFRLCEKDDSQTARNILKIIQEDMFFEPLPEVTIEAYNVPRKDIDELFEKTIN